MCGFHYFKKQKLRIQSGGEDGSLIISIPAIDSRAILLKKEDKEIELLRESKDMTV